MSAKTIGFKLPGLPCFKHVSVSDGKVNLMEQKASCIKSSPYFLTWSNSDSMPAPVLEVRLCVMYIKEGEEVCVWERDREHTTGREMELLLWVVCVLQYVYSIKCKHSVPVLIYVSGRAGGRVWVSAGVRTWSEGKGPTNAEWQLIMPDRYISICPPGPCLPLRAYCCHQAFQQRLTHSHTRTHTDWQDCFGNAATFCSKQSLAWNLIKQRACGAWSNRNKLQLHLMPAYLLPTNAKHIFVHTDPNWKLQKVALFLSPGTKCTSLFLVSLHTLFLELQWVL